MRGSLVSWCSTPGIADENDAASTTLKSRVRSSPPMTIGFDDPRVDERRDLPHARRHLRADADRAATGSTATAGPQVPDGGIVRRQCRDTTAVAPRRRPLSNGNCQVRHAHQLAVLAAEQRIGELVEAQREHAGQAMAAAQPLGSEDGAVGHRLRPGDVLLDRHRQGAGHDAAHDRPERRADHVVGHVAGRQQSLHDRRCRRSPRTTAAAHHRDELLVADLGVEFGGGEVVAVVLDEQLPLLVLVVGQSRASTSRCRVRALVGSRCSRSGSRTGRR